MSSPRLSASSRGVKQSSPNAAPASSTASKPSSSTMPSGPRKLASRSQRDSKGTLSRKLSKRKEQPAQTPPPEEVHGGAAAHDTDSKGKQRAHSSATPEPELQYQPPTPVVPVRSIVPDTLASLPSWYSLEVEWAAASAPLLRKKYHIHNPVGPRYYKNHHLFPPSLEKRPPSVFSPSFPPMPPSSDRLPDTAMVSAPSRSPSGSPQPTPSSSQVKIHDVRGRTRKISQTAQENAETLNTDPWGSNLHDRSPYDVGKSKDLASPDSPESPTFPVRPRRSSLTTVQRHKTTVPSPLSQSTSALHLATEPLSSTYPPPRRLSRRRKTFRGLFRSDRENRPFLSRGATSPLEHADASRQLGRKESRTGSIVPPSVASSAASVTATEASSKRQSMLGRLVKRFSIVRRSDASKSMKSSFHSSRQSTEIDPGRLGMVSPPADAPKRVPDESSADRSNDLRAREQDAESMLSADNRFSVGKLKVANPDDSGSDSDSPDGGSRPQGHTLDMAFRSSPEPIDYMAQQTPFYGHPIRGPLSVISEGGTYMSSPRGQPEPIPEDSPRTPPTIPSLLSLPARSAALPMDHTIHVVSPPLPALPLPNPSYPEIPNALSLTSVVSPPASAPAPAPVTLPPPPPVVPMPRIDASLPLTPEGSRAPTPPAEQPTPRPGPQALRQSELATPDISAERTPRPKPQPLSQPEPSHVPSSSAPPQRIIYRSLSSATNDTSILARASMIVNPPTPQSTSIAMPPASVTSQQAVVGPPRGDAKSPSQDDSTTKKDGSRRLRSKHTETFKLVRTASGNVQTVGNSFVADGEHWHVIESPADETSKKSRRERDHSTERDRSSKRKSKRAEKEGASEDSDQQRPREQASSPDPDRRDSPHQSSHPRARSDESQRRSSGHDRRRSHRDSQQDAARATQTPVSHSSKSYAPSPSPVSGTRIERRTSTSASTRPSSDFQSVADINTLKAKDAWEIERMWKGRSMVYAPDNMQVSSRHRHDISSDSRPTTIMSHDLQRASTIPSVGDAHTALSTYGSSTTSITLAMPPHPQHAASFPGATPLTHAAAARPATIALPPLPPLSSAPANPLPEPPRMSTYRPAPLPLALGGPGETAATAEYWNRYASVTVSH
ncbi:hypothetical protein PsYK624_159260 [Phanerochaete sordida]|uniref:Uncharacterized protein n=1 Tax=Phanerochaete sordida TaxID=48140 RepID=A0A9P3LLS0_9APHY|nr:hypothetical protein PsYK624_159260 [Phanerochaete sordida]